MSTDMTTHRADAEWVETTEAPRRDRRSWWTWVLGGLVVILAGVIAWLVLADDEDSEQADLPSGLRAAPAEVEAEIDALVNEWMMAWNEQDGEGVRDLFTDDFRFVKGFGESKSPNTALDGYDGDRLSDWIGSPRAFGYSATATDRVILERVGVYYVAQKFQSQADTPLEFLELYTIVDDDGTLRFQYIEGWGPLGWHQLAEGQPYQAVENQLYGWPISEAYSWEVDWAD